MGKGPVQHAANNDADEDEEDWDNDAPVPGKGWQADFVINVDMIWTAQDQFINLNLSNIFQQLLIKGRKQFLCSAMTS